MFDNISVLFLGLGQVCPLASQSVGGSNSDGEFCRGNSRLPTCIHSPETITVATAAADGPGPICSGRNEGTKGAY